MQQSEKKPKHLTVEEFETLLASETPDKPLTFVLKYRDQVIGSSAEGKVSDEELQRRLSEASKK